jgi:hypothetical protein
MQAFTRRQTMHALPEAEASLLARYRKDRVFRGTTLFGTYADRLVRKHTMLQFGVGDGHPVFEEEDRLIRESVGSIREYLRKSNVAWRVPWSTAKVVVVQYVRKAVTDRLRLQDLEEDVEEAVLESVYREEFEDLFPSNWFDS